MDELEERISAIEKALGIEEHPNASQEDLNVLELKKRLLDKGCERVFNIPLERLKTLKQVLYKSETRPLIDKVNAIQFCEDLIRQRVEFLKEFEENIKVVLDSEPLAAVSNHETALETVKKDIDDALELWKESTRELDEFRTELSALMTALSTHVADLERRVEERTK